MFKNRVKYAILLCILILLAGCSSTVVNSSESAAITTSVIIDTTPTQSTVTAGNPIGDKALFKERFAEARKVGVHYTAMCCIDKDAAPDFTAHDVQYDKCEYYKCEHYNSKVGLRSATAAIFTENCAQAFYALMDTGAYLDRDDRLYIAPQDLYDASVWQAEDTVSFQDQTVETFIWDSLTVTEAGDNSISYTMDWYHTYPGDPSTSVFTLVKGGDGIWRFDKCFGNEGTPLKAEELEQYNKAFGLLPFDGEGNASVNPTSYFFTSYYDRPEDINLVKFLWYFPSEMVVTDETEFEALKADERWVFGADATLDTMPVPIHRISAAAVNEALKKYTGITLDDLSGVGTEKLIYLKQYDAYYTYTSDFGPGFFVCTRGEKQGDLVRLYGGYATLTLRLEGDGFLIVSYQKTGVA